MDRSAILCFQVTNQQLYSEMQSYQEELSSGEEQEEDIVATNIIQRLRERRERERDRRTRWRQLTNSCLRKAAVQLEETARQKEEVARLQEKLSEAEEKKVDAEKRSEGWNSTKIKALPFQAESVQS